MNARNKPRARPEWALISRYVREQFRHRQIWFIALVVGTLINGYGQLFVPWLRGEGEPTTRFIETFTAYPQVGTLSIVVAYVFPLMVSAISAAYQRYRSRVSELRALFPDHKPDPVFRVASDGRIVDAGETTHALLTSLGVTHVHEVLGEELWARIRDTESRGSCVPLGTVVRFADGEYLLSYALVSGAAIQVYLAALGRPPP